MKTLEQLKAKRRKEQLDEKIRSEYASRVESSAITYLVAVGVGTLSIVGYLLMEFGTIAKIVDALR